MGEVTIAFVPLPECLPIYFLQKLKLVEGFRGWPLKETTRGRVSEKRGSALTTIKSFKAFLEVPSKETWSKERLQLLTAFFFS